MADIQHIRHSLAHLLAAAVLDLYPDAKPTIGPAIDDGFYYDFEFTTPINEKDLPRIEEKMHEIMGKWDAFTGNEVTRDEARERFVGNPYKLELIDEIADKGEQITLYTCGGFTDLCRGGHADRPREEVATGSWRLDRIAGAYWRGDEKNKMLTRIYGFAFESKDALDTYLIQQEEAKKRDHKILGPALKLYTISPLVGPGLPLMQPKGMTIRKALEDYLWSLHAEKGYSRVWTPHIAKEALYETSGHAQKFGDELFRVQGKEDKFILKPMNCPHHMQIFADNQFSYRDMPVRYFEPATVYRDEKSGQLGGLTRVRAITQDDGHLFCRPDQIAQEFATIVSIIKEFYTAMNMIDGYWVRLSLRGDDTSKYLGSDEVWATAEAALTAVCEGQGLPFRPAKDEAAFYGPKLDFMFKDAIGREWQLATIQCDFNLPDRFDLSYTNAEGKKERPVVIHRAISGSLERFMGVMIEHFAGAFPVWLAPEQVRVLSVSDEQAEFVHEVVQEMKTVGIRAQADTENATLGGKIRNAAGDKIPYVVVVGNKERESGELNIRIRGSKDSLIMSRADFIARVQNDITVKRVF